MSEEERLLNTELSQHHKQVELTDRAELSEGCCRSGMIGGALRGFSVSTGVGGRDLCCMLLLPCRMDYTRKD